MVTPKYRARERILMIKNLRYEYEYVYVSVCVSLCVCLSEFVCV